MIHEIVREEGEAELARAAPARSFWSGLAAGLSMGFSFLSLALIQSALPDTPSRQLLDSFGYAVGFVIVVLGRQELFTESTLTAVLPLLVRRDGQDLFGAPAVLGHRALAPISSEPRSSPACCPFAGLFTRRSPARCEDIAAESVGAPFWPTLVKAILAGWLIALMIWLLPSARSARLFVIMLLTYVVAIGAFPARDRWVGRGFLRRLRGQGLDGRLSLGFFVPTILGNTIGGVALVALLNHAPLAPELRGEEQP